MRRNIDAWWPHITAGVDAIVMTASGCGVTVKDYGLLLKSDPVYAEKAQRVSAITKDLSEILLEEDLRQLDVQPDGLTTAVHCPCTLQHGQQLPSVIDDILARVGLSTVATTDRHSCCGSAGSYSILQPAISRRLLDRKLQALTKSSPDRIVTANIGCQLYLETKAQIPVQNWIELLDERSSA